MNKLRAVLIAVIGLAPASSFAAGANITGTVGFRQLSNDWEPTETHAMGGVLADFSMWDAPLHIELGVRDSGDSSTRDGDRYKLNVADFMAGVAVIPDYGYVRPYVSFGLAAVEAEATLNGDRESDNSVGWYIGGGALWRLTPNFDLGVDGRYIGGTDVFNEADVNNFTVALRVGYGWDLHRRRYNDDDYPSRRRERRRY
ncbi:MAG TPA: porin family protein [Nevskiaceae bacterium]|nr:porin family protein [Nevskiaceae bacterium]